MAREDGDKAKPGVWIGTGWKMNKTLAEARAFAEAVLSDDGASDPCIQRFVVPPFTALREVKGLFRDSDVLVGALGSGSPASSTGATEAGTAATRSRMPSIAAIARV